VFLAIEPPLITTHPWAPSGTSDIKSDILWQYHNAASPSDPFNGEAAIWLMNGTAFTFQDTVGAPPASGHAKGTADLNGDGKSNILWQNDNGQAGAWFMNGTNPTQETIFASPPPPSWPLTVG